NTNPARQLFECRHELGAGVSGADHDECEQLSASPGVVGQRGGLKQIDDVIPDSNRVAGSLEREPVFRDPRDDSDIGTRAERQDEAIVLNLLSERGPAMARDQPTTTDIDGFDRHFTELDAQGAAERPDRVDDVTRPDRPGSRLGEHRREEKEVSITDEGDMDWERAGASLCQLDGGRDAGEPSTHDEHPRRQGGGAPGQYTADPPPIPHGSWDTSGRIQVRDDGFRDDRIRQGPG